MVLDFFLPLQKCHNVFEISLTIKHFANVV